VTGADQFRNQMNEIPDAPRRFASHGAGDRFATTQGRALWVELYRFPTAFQWVTEPVKVQRADVVLPISPGPSQQREKSMLREPFRWSEF